jgi:hypothetical protein
MYIFIHYVGKMQSSLTLKQLVHIETTVLYLVNALQSFLVNVFRI